jgi:ABC-2 type transport system permease protein
MLPQAGGVSLVERFISMLSIVMAILCSIPTIQMITKLKGEEKNNRTDHILGRAVSRNNLLGSYLVIGFIVSVVGLFLSGYGMYMASAQVMDNPVPLMTILKSGMSYLPAVWILLGLATFLIGFKPKFLSITWIYLLYSFIVNYLGQILQLPEVFANLTPFAYIPKIPVEELKAIPLLSLTILSVALIVFGFNRYRNRDITA